MAELTPYEKKALKEIEETRTLMTQQIVQEKNETNEQFEQRKRALTFDKINQLKHILLQNVSRNGTNRSFTQYTKSLIQSYLQNPYSYRDQIREVSRFLWRVSALYKRLIMTYATMPLYNYNLTQKVSFTKTINANRAMSDYEKTLKRLQPINFYDEFATANALALRDGVYYSFVYDNGEDGLFFHTLDPQYCKILGKNEAGVWIVCFDATYFSRGNNIIFVDGINGDTSGCWDQVFIDGYHEYLNNRDARWFILPPEKTMCLLASENDSFDLILPYFSGIMEDILIGLDARDLVSDRQYLENFVLLVSRIPLLSGTNTVDDFAVSLEICKAMQELIDAAVPELVGTAMSPMQVDAIKLKDSNDTDQTDIISKSISNTMKNAGVTPNLLSASETANAVAQKYSVLNDTSLIFLLISRLELNFNYYINKNISTEYMFEIHRETWYNEQEYIENKRQLATLGAATALDLMTATGMTPYEAICKLRFEDAIGIKSLMVPLMSSYNTSSDSIENRTTGRPRVDDEEAGESTERTRDNTTAS